MTERPNREIAPASRHPRDDTDLKRCAACGADIDPTRRTPAATPPDSPSTVFLFCSEDCRDDWTAAHDSD